MPQLILVMNVNLQELNAFGLCERVQVKAFFFLLLFLVHTLPHLSLRQGINVPSYPSKLALVSSLLTWRRFGPKIVV